MAVAVALAVSLGAASRQAGAVTERVVVDFQTGLAIYGYDPVAYFTRAAPTKGRTELEKFHAGAVWRFRNEGNLSAFNRDPAVFMPVYGGYDAMALIRGVAVPGNPLIWLINADRVFLFYDDGSRAAFAANPTVAKSLADAQWQDVRRTLIDR
ncbi:MAG: hypothetical protein HY056_15795 [Proteobacteria bacterium]|nr:hypothetical protein [Pseudomonadota bacterium]